MDIGSLFHSISGMLDNQTRNNDSVDTDGLLGGIANLFRQHGYNGPQYYPTQTGGYNGQPILPASQDPLGDPADQGYVGQQSNILPASQDPLGDPADQR